MKRYFLLAFLPVLCYGMTEEEFNNIVYQASSDLISADSYVSSVLRRANTYNDQIVDQLDAASQSVSLDPSAYNNGYLAATRHAVDRWNDQYNFLLSDTDAIRHYIVLVQDSLNNLRFTSGSDTNLVEIVRQFKLSFDNFKVSFEGYKTKAETFLDWANDIQGEFQKYFTLVNERLETPDANLSTDLATMWRYLLENVTNVVSRPESYPLESSLNHLNIDGDTLRLSNEGLIGAANLAVNERSYLTQVAQLQELRTIATNQTDLTFLTNYLFKTQQPFYQFFNEYQRIYQGTTTAFTKFRYDATTNFFKTIKEPYNLTSWNKVWNTYRTSGVGSNAFQRIEMALYNLAGAFDYTAPLLTKQEVEENLTEETSTRRLDYVTNDVPRFLANAAPVTNSLSRVLNAFQEFTGEFFYRHDAQYEDTIMLTPTLEMGSITIPYINVTFDPTYMDVIREIFSVIWYAIFVVIGFKMVLMVIYLFGKAVSHLVLIFSTLLS